MSATLNNPSTPTPMEVDAEIEMGMEMETEMELDATMAEGSQNSLPMLEPIGSIAQPSSPQPHPNALETVDAAAGAATEEDAEMEAGPSEEGSEPGEGNLSTHNTPIPPGNATSTSSASSAAAARGRRQVMRQVAAYEVIDLAASSEEEESDDDRRSYQYRRRSKYDVPGKEYPPVESFLIDLRQVRVVSGRALRRQMLPLLYPPSPPPPKDDEDGPGEIAGGSSTPTGEKKKRSKRRRELDYYDCTDSFIDDSELIDDGVVGTSGGVGEDGEDGPHSLSPSQLQSLYDSFVVTSAASIEDYELIRAEQAAKKTKKAPATASTLTSASKEKSSKAKPVTAASTVAMSTKKKKVESKESREAEKEGESTAVPPSSSKKDALDGSTRKKAVVRREKKDSSVPAEPEPPLPPPEIGTLDKDWINCFERFPATPAVVSLIEEILLEYRSYQSTNQSQSATAASTTSQPPIPSSSSTVTAVAAASVAPDAGQMTPTSNATTAEADGSAPSGPTSAANPSGSVAPITVNGTPASNPSPSEMVTEASSKDADGDGLEGALDLTQDDAVVAPPSAPDSGPSRTRIGLRQKSVASIVAHKPPTKMPETLSKLLSKLGAELETQRADETTVNKFLSVLTLKLIWSRKILKDRLMIGRLEGQITLYLKERFELYQQLRAAIRADIEAQASEFAALHLGSMDGFPAFYQPRWSSYMRTLLDYATYTDDILDALEELEWVLPKKSKELRMEEAAPLPTSLREDAAAATAIAQATPTGPPSADAAQETSLEFHLSRATILHALWQTLNIPADSYPSNHLPLVLSLTSTLYANLPVLWHWTPVPPTDDASLTVAPIPLVTESTVEREIDAAEEAAQEAILQQEREAAAAAEAAAEEEKRAEEERKREAEAKARHEQAELEREAQEILQLERQRKANKAAAAAAAAAAATANANAASSSSVSPTSSSPNSGEGGSEKLLTSASSSGLLSVVVVEKKKKRKKSLAGELDRPTKSSRYAPLPPPSERWKPILVTPPPSPPTSPNSPVLIKQTQPNDSAMSNLVGSTPQRLPTSQTLPPILPSLPTHTPTTRIEPPLLPPLVDHPEEE